MPVPDSIASRAAALRPCMCSSTGGGLDAAWVHVAGALDLATTPQLGASQRAREEGRRLILLRGTPNVDRVFALTGSSDDIEMGDIDPLVDLPGQLHLQFADETLIP